MEEGMKKCPACAEDIKAEAKKCRYCGEVFEDIKKEKVEEVEIFRIDSHWTANIIPVLLICTIWLFPIGLYYVAYNGTKLLKLTNKRVSYMEGIITKINKGILIGKIENVNITIGIIEGMFGCGTISVTGTGGDKIRFANVKNPKEVKKQIEDVLN